MGGADEDHSDDADVELPPAGGDVPPIDFTTFILSLSENALAHLSGSVAPGTDGKEQLGLARQTIDVLVLLETKTRGNLDGEEERLLNQVLSDIKLRYVAKARG
ncbi:MAG: DUF1844 domain-containing protein [Deltaproteobacteria bacterium]|nr:MAG: DUF1844 domain-containing protein [Deltaproteobacteria bacterium]